MNMGFKDETRYYSLITRRAKEIISKVNINAEYTIDDIAVIICTEDKDSEFFLKFHNRQISKPRAITYIRFLIDIGVFIRIDKLCKLDFLPRQTDEAWSQALSDQSVRYLQRVIVAPKTPEITTDKVPEILKSKIKQLMDHNLLPTLENVVDLLSHLETERQKELFRWALYLYTDSKNCPLDIHRYPVLMMRK